jgi:signal transduction histidine kinase
LTSAEKPAADASAISRMQGKVVIAFGMALVCIGAIGGLQYQTVRRLSEDNSRVAHNQSVLRQLDAVRGSLNRADAFAQSFVATGEESDWISYNQAIAELKQHLRSLEEVTAESSIQQSKLKELEKLAGEGTRAMQSETEDRKQGKLGTTALLRLEGSIRKAVNSMRSLSSEMEAEEFRALRVWTEQAQAANHETNLLIGLGCLVACVLLSSAGVGLYLDLKERGKAEASRAAAYEVLQHANQGLEKEARERAEAQRNLQDSERRMRELSRRLLRMQDEEHRRIGRELHDSLGQYLAALKMGLDSTKIVLAGKMAAEQAQAKLAECSDLLEESIREVRTMSYLLHPPLLEECGLRSAIPSYVEGFSKRSGIQVTVEIEANFTRLGDDAELALFRVLQESLTNVHRHSGSATAHVQAFMEEALAVLEISDHGKGIALDGRPDLPPKAGVGLEGMAERMRQLGGDLQMESGEHGTTIRASIPQAAKTVRRAAG